MVEVPRRLAQLRMGRVDGSDAVVERQSGKECITGIMIGVGGWLGMHLRSQARVGEMVDDRLVI